MAQIHIKANRPWLYIDWRGILQYRDLLWLLVVRDFVVLYKQSILGPLWFIIQPLATTIVFVVVFGHIAKIGTGGIPNLLFYMSGTIFWTYFHNCLIKISGALISNANLFKKVFFPRLIVPFSIVVSNLGILLLNLIMLAAFFLYFLFYTEARIAPGLELVVVLPLLILQCATIGLGVGLWVSALTVKYRDLGFAVPFLSQLWMFMTPVVYPVSEFPAKWRWILKINPMTSVMELARHSLFGVETMWQEYIVSGAILAVILLVTGVLVFNKVQRTFVDTI
ncbi:MAG: ABC transporter permease [Desulfobacterales bacterium]|nr:ABC transporter permease [Desulfobacterales bacterium]